MSDKQYYWIDIESGQKFECSKEYYENQLKQFNDIIPKFNGEFQGTVMMMGTGGEQLYPKTFEEAFKNTNIKPITDEQENKNYFIREARKKE